MSERELPKRAGDALRAIKIRIAFIGMPQEPMCGNGPAWGKEIMLIESVLPDLDAAALKQPDAPMKTDGKKWSEMSWRERIVDCAYDAWTHGFDAETPDARDYCDELAQISAIVDVEVWTVEDFEARAREIAGDDYWYCSWQNSRPSVAYGAHRKREPSCHGRTPEEALAKLEAAVKEVRDEHAG